MVELSLPDWVEHPIIDEKKRKRQTIFTLHVHPDGSRLATGGLDQKVRIWATEPILKEELQNRKDVHKLLCAMSRHSGSVLVVRWSPSGRYLASGSDDTICLIWELDPTGLGGGSFGSFGSREDEASVESWRPHRRLVGHESDIVDLAWSTDEEDSYLATVGLDSRVIVWSGARSGPGSFERIRVISGHEGFVKGVVWDPIGQYLATASDDKTVKVWRVGGDWGLVQTITKPFEKSKSTFFRRCSWSPDGAHLLCANATSGSIFTANVTKREDWSSDVNLVGHENAVAVTAFSPQLIIDFDDETPSETTIMAVGSLDQSISLWQAGHRRPLTVVRDIFQLQIMDLSWASNGRTLYACSADGYIAAFTFTKDELSVAPAARLAKARETFGYEQHQRAFQRSKQTQSATLNGFGGYNQGTTDRPNVLQARKAGVPRAPITAQSIVSAPTSSQPTRLDQQITLTRDGKRRIKPTLLNGEDNALDSSSNYAAHSYDVPAVVGGSSSVDIPPSPTIGMRGHKRTASMAHTDFDDDVVSLPAGKKFKDVGRTIGGDLQRGQDGPAVTLQRQGLANGKLAGGVASSIPPHSSLDIPPILSLFKKEEFGRTIELRNFEDNTRPSEIYHFEAGSSRSSWMDFYPSAALLATTNEIFSAVSFEDGTLAMYTSKGRRTATLQLETPCYRMENANNVLIVITVTGHVRRWDVRTDCEIGMPLSVLPLFATHKYQLGSLDHDEISHFWVHSNGAPVLVMRSERAYTLDRDRGAWTLISCGWYVDCSTVWEGRTRGRGASVDATSSQAMRRDPVRVVESTMNDLVIIQRATTGIQPACKPSAERMEDFRLAVTLRHYETRLTAAALLDSPHEYRHHLLSYARRLGEEGIRNQAEDLCRSLMGPVYHLPGIEAQKSTAAWSSTVCGLQKRELLSDVLKNMTRGRLLLGLVDHYQKLLKEVQAQTW